MYAISTKLYNEVAERFRSRFSGSDYASGVIEFDYGDHVWCRLVVSAIVYRRRERADDGDQWLISDAIPVWWEFHTTLDKGEVMNDFSFNTLREYLKE